MAAKRKAVNLASQADIACAKALAQTRPTTPAGAGAFLDYILTDDLTADESYWHMTAIRTIAAALREMNN